MDELKALFKEQERDAKSYKVGFTFITPHIFRFNNFAGSNPKEKAFSVFKFLGWRIEDIATALNMTLADMHENFYDFEVTVVPENYKKFFVDIPQETIRDKAIIILKALNWKEKAICKALTISRRTVCYVSAAFRKSQGIVYCSTKD